MFVFVCFSFFPFFLTEVPIGEEGGMGEKRGVQWGAAACNPMPQGTCRGLGSIQGLSRTSARWTGEQDQASVCRNSWVFLWVSTPCRISPASVSPRSFSGVHSSSAWGSEGPRNSLRLLTFRCSLQRTRVRGKRSHSAQGASRDKQQLMWVLFFFF